MAAVMSKLTLDVFTKDDKRAVVLGIKALPRPANDQAKAKPDFPRIAHHGTVS